MKKFDFLAETYMYSCSSRYSFTMYENTTKVVYLIVFELEPSASVILFRLYSNLLVEVSYWATWLSESCRVNLRINGAPMVRYGCFGLKFGIVME